MGKYKVKVNGGSHEVDHTSETDDTEKEVGKDLQYIWINGALAGGLVGLAIFVAARLLG